MEPTSEPGTLLAREIRRRHWSREHTLVEMARTAREMGIRGYTLSLRQLDRWLAGLVGVPRGPACRVAERLFGYPIEVLLAPVSTVDLAQPRNRFVASDPAGILTHRAAQAARQHSRHTSLGAVDAVRVEHLHGEVRRLARSYAVTPPHDLLVELVEAQGHVYTMLEHTRRPGDLVDLYLIAGQVCGLAATTSFDLGDAAAADDLAAAAWTYGQMCGHDTLRAWVRGVQATVAFWSGRPGEGLRFATDGLRYASGAAAVRLHAIAARAWTLTPGGADHAVAALRRAAEARDRDAGHDEMSDGIGGEFAFRPERLALCSGAVYIGLGNGAAAARAASEALRCFDQTPAEQQRWAVRHGALIDLATARAQQNDPDGAMDALAPALDLDVGRRTVRLIRRLTTLRKVATRGPFRSAPAASHLTDCVDEWTAGALAGRERQALTAS